MTVQRPPRNSWRPYSPPPTGRCFQPGQVHPRRAEYLARAIPLPLLDLRDSHDLIEPVLNAIHLENLLHVLAGAAFGRVESYVPRFACKVTEARIAEYCVFVQYSI